MSCFLNCLNLFIHSEIKIKPWYFDVLVGVFGIEISLRMVRFDFRILGRMMVNNSWIEADGIGELMDMNMAIFVGSLSPAATKKSSFFIIIVFVLLLLVNVSLWFMLIPYAFLSQVIC